MDHSPNNEVDVGQTEVDGELLSREDGRESSENEETAVSPVTKPANSLPASNDGSNHSENSKYYLQYVFLPLILLTVTLLGGLRVSNKEAEFVFHRPALSSLILASLLLVLFVRSGLIKFDGWISQEFSGLRNAANGAVFLTLFSATVQVFNSLIPEQGLAFWVIGFCFLWTLWNNLFSEFNPRKLLTSVGGLFGFAFVAKYLVLANMISGGKGSWLGRIWEDPARETFTYFLNLPDFAPATGYIQFFALVFYLFGLFLLTPRSVGASKPQN